MKKIVFLLVTLICVLVSSVCFAASGTVGNGSACGITVSYPTQNRQARMWDRMPRLILKITGAPDPMQCQARVKIRDASGTVLQSQVVYGGMNFVLPNTTVTKYYITFDKVDNKRTLYWQLVKNPNAVHNVYPCTIVTTHYGVG